MHFRSLDEALQIPGPGQRWTDDRVGMTLRLPLELREGVTEEARVKGDLTRIVFLLSQHANARIAPALTAPRL
jgi:hypothetical protein